MKISTPSNGARVRQAQHCGLGICEAQSFESLIPDSTSYPPCALTNQLIDGYTNDAAGCSLGVRTHLLRA